MTDSLRITTLSAPGTPVFEIVSPSGGALGPGKPFALLVYLACSPRFTAGRELLVDLLWADADPDAARHALRQVTWYARRRLGDGVIETDGTSLALRAPFSMDRERFISLVEAGEYAAAVETYVGDFLPGFAVPGGGEFDRWADLERQRLRSMFVRSAELVTREAMQNGRYKDAQSLARRMRDVDSLNQATWRLLLESLVTAHDILGAATEADRLEQFLQAEEIEPDPATRAALKVARNPRVSEATGAGDAAEPSRGLVIDLIGREREFGRLLAGWDAARGGAASHVHVVAPAGIGKTRLVRDLHARLRAMRSRVVFVRANPGERTIPFAVVADVAAALAALPGAAGLAPAAAATLVALNPSLSSIYRVEPDASTGDEALRRRSIALAELARSVAEDAPLAILVDDVHWADDASRQVLAGAAPRLRDARILLVSASRPIPELASARTERDELRLEPLTVVQVQEFVTNVARLPDDAWSDAVATALHAATNGSPLLLLETLQLAIERGVLRVRDNVWVCDQPADLAELLRAGSAVDRRIAPLERAEAWCLLVLAVAGMPLPFAAVGGLGANAADALHELERRGLAHRTVSGWLPEHDEIADAAVRRASPESVRAAHLKLGEALAPLLTAEPMLRPVVTRHLIEGGDRDALRALFVDQLRHMRAAGDRRPTRRIAESFLGPDVPGFDARALASGVPWRVRSRARWTAIGTIATGMLLLAGIGARLWNGDPPVEVWIVGNAEGRPVVQPVSPSALRSGLAIELGADHARPLGAPSEATSASHSEVFRVGDGQWAFSKNSGDSGGLDIYLREANGATRRLTNQRADDGVADVAPDGSKLLVTSGRSTPGNRTNLGLYDLRTNVLTRFAASEQLTTAGHWSPDGTRIAFSRMYYVPHAPELCVIAVDGTGERCRAYPGVVTADPFAWRDARTLIVRIISDSVQTLAFVDAESFDQRNIAQSVGILAASSDGRFVTATEGGVSGQSGRLVLIDVDHPDRRLTLTLHHRTPQSVDFSLLTGNQTRPAPYLARVRIVVPGAGVPVDLVQRLHAEATDASGGTTAAEVLSWSSLDTLVATVSPDGRLTPRRKGSARIVASAGGWRADTERVTIVAPQAALQLVEDWSTLDTLRWAPFGDPRPKVAEVRGRRALLVNGDSSFLSGLHEQARRRVGDGLAIHTEFSLPRSEAQWQSLEVLAAGVDSAVLAKWDHRTDREPGTSLDRCGVTVPHGEGYPSATKFDAVGPGGERHVFDARWMMDGRWVALDVQLFPDGTCGVALDGKPLVVSRNSIDPRSSVVVHLQGYSWRTIAAIGRSEIWTGVRPGIDWSRLRGQDDVATRAPRQAKP